MGDSDDSSQGGKSSPTTSTSPTSSSSRRRSSAESVNTVESHQNSHNDSSQQLSRINGKSSTRKKKSRRKSSSGTTTAASDADTQSSDIEKGNKRTVRKKKRPPSQSTKGSSSAEGGGNDGVGGGDIKDSMLVAIKNKRKANLSTNGNTGADSTRNNLERRVSLSGSTLQRDIERNEKIANQPALEKIDSIDLDTAMGKIPIASFDTNNSALMAAMGKLPQPALKAGDSNDSPGSALRPSKYGDTKRRTNLAAEEPAERRTSFAKEEEPAETSEQSRKVRLSFKFVDYGSSDDDDNDVKPPPPWTAKRSPSWTARRQAPRRSLTTPSLNDGPSQQSKKPPQSINSEEREPLPRGGQSRHSSWKPDHIGPHKSRSSESLESAQRIPRRSLDSDDEIKSSITAQRPGIKKRNSMESMTSSSNRQISFDAQRGSDSNNAIGDRRSTMSKMQFANISKKKQMRRLNMSVEHQTFIPPKSRKTSVLQAMGHLMAGRLIDLTLWTYSASFMKVMTFFLMFYIVNIFVWAAVMDAVDHGSGGRCIHEDAELLSRSDRYEFVFELSWATFTTVGYGTISPRAGVTGCYAIRFTCAFVAFVGVLFGSTTAAIMYSKLMRLLAKAHVTFSSTLCVQYGKGNEGSTVRFGQLNFRASVAPAAFVKNFSASDLLADSDEDSPSSSEDGFPVIEFRMINDRANHEGSEIWDAQIRGIVQLHKEQPSENKRATNRVLLKDKATGGESTLDLEKKVYYPISLSPDSHPHFSRIWYARHVLNAESPLLKREIRDMIVKDGGKWDNDFNNWEEIRDCLNEFISLRITLSGTSAVSASTVYGEHVYEFDDVCVGWRFANMVYEKKERVYKSLWRTFGLGRNLREDEKENHDTAGTRTKIDAALLHDIVPQPGGDHEPLNETKNSDMAPRSFFLKMFTFGLYNGGEED